MYCKTESTVQFVSLQLMFTNSNTFLKLQKLAKYLLAYHRHYIYFNVDLKRQVERLLIRNS